MTERVDRQTGLLKAEFVGFIPVRSLAAARDFYVGVLGLTLVEENRFAVVVESAGTTVRLTEVTDLRAQPFTIAGWEVTDIGATVASLIDVGVLFSHYDGLDQDEHGIWTTPGGDLVAWFVDQDGNTLSLTERVRT